MRRIPFRIASAVVTLVTPVGLLGQAPRAAIRDSSGVQIVAYDTTIVPPQFELRDTGLDIGSEPGSELVRVSAALRMPNGKILVADGGRRHLMRFGADGRFEKVIGRDGQGPGEFERLGWMGRHSRDLVAAYDFGQARYSVFSDSGFLRQVRLQASPDVRFVEITPLGVLASGTIVVTGGRSLGLAAQGPPRLLRPVSPVVAYGADGTPGRVIGRYPGMEIEVSMVRNGPAAGTFANGPRLFGRGSALGMTQERIIVIDTEWFRFDVIDTTGRLIRRVRREVDGQPVRASHLAAYVRERVDAARPQFRESLRKDLESQAHAPVFPALDARLVIDTTGRVWLGEYHRPGDQEQAWWIFTVDGRMVGRVNVPVRLTITDAGADWVLGTWRDEDGVQTIRLYDLRPVTGRD
jgi:hypothetical protein